MSRARDNPDQRRLADLEPEMAAKLAARFRKKYSRLYKMLKRAAGVGKYGPAKPNWLIQPRNRVHVERR